MLWPGVHVAIWTAAAYLLIAIIVPGHELAVLMLGAPAAVLVGVGVLRVAHHAQLVELLHLGYRLTGRNPRPNARARPRRALRDPQ